MIPSVFAPVDGGTAVGFGVGWVGVGWVGVGWVGVGFVDRSGVTSLVGSAPGRGVAARLGGTASRQPAANTPTTRPT